LRIHVDGLPNVAMVRPDGPVLCVVKHPGLRFSYRVPHGPDLCVGSTPAWTAPLIFEPRCLTVLGRARADISAVR